MFYFGHELHFRSITHKSNVNDSTSIGRQVEIKAKETALAYGILVGWKWMSNAGGPGFIVDGYVGVDIGYRNYERLHAKNETYDRIFQSVDKSELYLPINFGVHIGWAGHKWKLRRK